MSIPFFTLFRFFSFFSSLFRLRAKACRRPRRAPTSQREGEGTLSRPSLAPGTHTNTSGARRGREERKKREEEKGDYFADVDISMGSQVAPSSGGVFLSSSSTSSSLASSTSAATWQPVDVGVQQICFLLAQSVKPGANQAEVREGIDRVVVAVVVVVVFFRRQRRRQRQQERERERKHLMSRSLILCCLLSPRSLS